MPRKQERCRRAAFGEGARGHLVGKMGPRGSREGIWPTKWGSAARERAFGRQNGAPRLARGRLAGKMGPRGIAKGRLVGKMGLRGIAKGHLVGKMGLRELAKGHLAGKMGNREGMNF